MPWKWKRVWNGKGALRGKVP